MKYSDHQVKKNNLTFGEVEGEGGLIDAQIVDVREIWELTFAVLNNIVTNF